MYDFRQQTLYVGDVVVTSGRYAELCECRVKAILPKMVRLVPSSDVNLESKGSCTYPCNVCKVTPLREVSENA